jgi:hypothetical protein
MGLSGAQALRGGCGDGQGVGTLKVTARPPTVTAGPLDGQFDLGGPAGAIRAQHQGPGVAFLLDLDRQAVHPRQPVENGESAEHGDKVLRGVDHGAATPPPDERAGDGKDVRPVFVNQALQMPFQHQQSFPERLPGFHDLMAAGQDLRPAQQPEACSAA